MESSNWFYTPSSTTAVPKDAVRFASGQTHIVVCATPGVEKVIYNDPATIVIWNDGTKTVVRCHPEDEFDEERGFLMCCAKRLFGNRGRFNDVLREHCWSRR